MKKAAAVGEVLAVVVLAGDNGNGEPDTNTRRCSSGTATTAKVRALQSLTGKARYGQEDSERPLSPLNASRFEELTQSFALYLR